MLQSFDDRYLAAINTAEDAGSPPVSCPAGVGLWSTLEHVAPRG
jgi:hypothetical protein